MAEYSKRAKLGSGKRFAEIEEKAKAEGVKNPGAVAAAAGRKAHGEKAMERYSHEGKARNERHEKALRDHVASREKARGK